MAKEQDPSKVERIKEASEHLRGTIVDGLSHAVSGSIADDDTQLVKFHGIYQQDDRDLRLERQDQRLEPAYQFMIRVRLPGGRLTTEQWLRLSQLAREHGQGDLRLTTRQTFQFHGIVKDELKPTLQGIHHALLDTLAACGDVNRNVMAGGFAELSPLHRIAHEDALTLGNGLLPKTRAYHEIWLDGEKVTSAEHEPLYGKTYLPRKFKIGIAIPPSNDIDVFTQDLGFVAHGKNTLEGYTVLVGGGMGRSHGEENTYPRLATPIAFIERDQLLELAIRVIEIQRDFGNRSNRKRARLKYTIDDRGIAWFRAELEKRLSTTLAPARDVTLDDHADRLGWQHGHDGSEHFTLFVPSGRVGGDLLHRIDRICHQFDGALAITPNQNVCFVNVPQAQRQWLADSLGTVNPPDQTTARAMACVGLPTCGLAMAESERMLEGFTERLRELVARHGLDGGVDLRVTGCPNGCARPYVSEIGLVGKAPGKYQLWLGGNRAGSRLNRLVDDGIDEDIVLDRLDTLMTDFRSQGRLGESFADFVDREVVDGA